MSDAKILTATQIRQRLSALDFYESSQWAILRSGEDDPYLVARQLDGVSATRRKLLQMLKEAPHE